MKFIILLLLLLNAINAQVNNTRVYTKQELIKISNVKNTETINKYVEEITDHIISSANNGKLYYQWVDVNYEFTKKMIHILMGELRKRFIDVKITDEQSIYSEMRYKIIVDWN